VKSIVSHPCKAVRQQVVSGWFTDCVIISCIDQILDIEVNVDVEEEGSPPPPPPLNLSLNAPHLASWHRTYPE